MCWVPAGQLGAMTLQGPTLLVGLLVPLILAAPAGERARERERDPNLNNIINCF